jgi:hypothetical protein
MSVLREPSIAAAPRAERRTRRLDTSGVPIADTYGRLAIAAILGVMGLQLLFLTVGCGWDFCGDEAEYWTWSRRLDWSYHSRGPLIAWLLRLAMAGFGWISLTLTGSLMLAARLPAVLLGGLTAWGVFRLTEETTGSRRAGWLATLLLPAIPLFAIGGVLITCDTPLVCCWTWAAVWTFRALRAQDGGPALRRWVAAGVIAALGVMAKYSVLALPASIGVFLLLSPRHRRQLVRPGFWTMAVLCVGLGLAPVVIWNARHGWAGAGQLADRVGLSDRSNWGGLWPVVSFLGGEAAVLGGIWWVAGIAALAGAFRDVLSKHDPSPRAARPRMDCDGALYLLALWGVIWCACLAASLLGETEANWMAPGYIALVVLIGWRMSDVLARGGRRAVAYGAAWCIAILAVVAIHHTDWFYPLLSRRIPAPTKRWPAPLRRYDVTARMRGHQELARAVARRIEALQAEGTTPFVVTPTYALAATLEFYLPGQPETYCLSWNLGMSRRPVNQHDLWHPNPRTDTDAFLGRTAIIVEDANMPPSYSTLLYHKQVFTRIGPVERVEVRERGVVVGAWDVTVCRDYRGIANYAQNPGIRPGGRTPKKSGTAGRQAAFRAPGTAEGAVRVR